MDTLKELYKVGNGPSSSHTMGPQFAALRFKNRHPNANRYVVELYGSLAATGRGHLTDKILYDTLGKNKTEVIFKPELFYDYHPNGMKLFAYSENNTIIEEELVFSVGGGSLKGLNEPREIAHKSYYPLRFMNDILHYCEKNNMSLLDYVLECEDDDILEFSKNVVVQMFDTVEKGLKKTGYLPGPLKIQRRANSIYNKYIENKDFNSLVFSATLAVSEENASGGIVVTTPTCGASGVLPGVMYAYFKTEKCSIEDIAKAVLVGGLVGNLVKHNASISGAEVGCQGEVGTACSMTAAALAYLKGGNNKHQEYAAEIALEHHLGMTCDPILGYVQIPCIERNALSARRAIDSCNFALLTDGNHYIKLDDVIVSLKETGKDLHSNYRETSLGGLAKIKLPLYEETESE
ncbi:MAG: L-serine ammonia-lyase, iron-sulfur-dependent, subunit alpha [Bacilli bacterium]|nr:L-serine ammonia-lyase, iron-sulfur-dependent, subunit alpha [Bacilli bacterium]